MKAVGEIQNNFSLFDLQVKRIIVERIDKAHQMQGNAISMDTLLNFMGNYRY